MASRSELAAFLQGVEKRAFKQAVFAVRDEEAALDIVQDAMLRLAEK
ncbi:MAG TPA: RNA polymerase sigma factor, partial [Burkholderiales bacterium]|nr:RNA polymerase sigma factor [Burkholderiales bacterium]